MPRKKQAATPLPAGLSGSDGEQAATASLEDVKKPMSKTSGTPAAAKKSTPAKKKQATTKKKPATKAAPAEPVVEFEKLEEEIPVEPSPWEKVGCLSDDLITVEAVNIAPFGKKCVMLRFLVNGKLLGNVITIQDIQYRVGSGKFT